MIPWLTSRWTWYGMAGLAVLLGALWLRHHYIEQGKQQGKEEQAQAVEQDIEQQRKLAKAQTQAAIAVADQKIQEAESRAQQAQADAALYAARAQALAGQLVSGRQQVAGVPQDALHTFALMQITQHPMTGESTDPERAIAERVVAAPILVEQNKALAGQVSRLGEQVQALSDKVTALEEKDQVRAAYEERLEGWYTQLYNLHPPRKRSPKCLYLWRCAVNRLPVPSPAEVHKEKP